MPFTYKRKLNEKSYRGTIKSNDRREKMKNYLSPEIEIVEVKSADIITTSPGTETPWYEETDGSWELSVN